MIEPDIAGVPLALVAPLRAGKLEQVCGACGTWEAAGWYCSACERQTGPDDWYKPVDPVRAANLARARAARHGRTPERGSCDGKSALPPMLTA